MYQRPGEAGRFEGCYDLTMVWGRQGLRPNHPGAFVDVAWSLAQSCFPPSGASSCRSLTPLGPLDCFSKTPVLLGIIIPPHFFQTHIIPSLMRAPNPWSRSSQIHPYAHPPS